MKTLLTDAVVVNIGETAHESTNATEIRDLATAFLKLREGIPAHFRNTFFSPEEIAGLWGEPLPVPRARARRAMKRLAERRS